MEMTAGSRPTGENHRLPHLRRALSQFERKTEDFISARLSYRPSPPQGISNNMRCLKGVSGPKPLGGRCTG